jgi:hypothetical protein
MRTKKHGTATYDALRAVESLDDCGDAREELKEADPEEELLHSSLLDGKARTGEPFTEEEATLDVMLAVDREDLRPLRYYAARWSWSKNRVHRALDELAKTAGEWRGFNGRSVGQAGTEVGQAGTRTGPNGTKRAASGTKVGQAGTRLGQYRSDPDTRPKGATPLTPTARDEAPGFVEFWTAYPKKRGRKTAEKAYAKAVRGSPDLPARLLADVAARKAGDDRWRRGFIPDPATYINQERWTDELSEPATRTDGRPLSPARAAADINPAEAYTRIREAVRGAAG